jgi:predicted nucleic acid-binding Zn ribbon protein
MTKKFTVEIRDTCKVCGGKLPNSRYRTYCSKKCRKKFYNDRDKEKLLEWQRIRRAKQRAKLE